MQAFPRPPLIAILSSPSHPCCVPIIPVVLLLSTLCPHRPHSSCPCHSHHVPIIQVVLLSLAPCEPVACRHDGKRWGSHAISPVNCPPSLVDPSSAPVIHPASRCLQWWWWWRSLSPVVSPPSRLPSPLLFHPPTTPRAVARKARGGWCVVRGPSSVHAPSTP